MTIMKAQKSGHLVDVPSMTEEFRSPDIFTYCGVKAAIIKMLQAFQNGRFFFERELLKFLLRTKSHSSQHFYHRR